MASLSVAVIVDVLVPSAVTDVGLAATVEVLAETAPAVKVTWAVPTCRLLSLVSVAV